jgi:hypothetical protein
MFQVHHGRLISWPTSKPGGTKIVFSRNLIPTFSISRNQPFGQNIQNSNTFRSMPRLLVHHPRPALIICGGNAPPVYFAKLNAFGNLGLAVRS